MAKVMSTFSDATETVRPYIERAMSDEKLRDEVMRAFATARELYAEFMAEKGRPMTLASRVATDEEIREKLREAIEDLRSANERLQGRVRERSSARTSAILVAGLALGILFNPVTGPETRRFIRDLLSSGDDQDARSPDGSNGRG